MIFYWVGGGLTNYFKKIFCILSAHNIDYNLCEKYFVPITDKENNTFDTIPFTKCIRKLIYPYLFMTIIIHRRYVYRFTVKITLHNFILEMH